MSWIFRNKKWAKDALNSQVCGRARTLEDRSVTQHERSRVLLEHSRHFESLWGVNRFPAMRKHLAWYCKGFRGAAQWRTRMVQAQSVRDVETIVKQAAADNFETTANSVQL